MADGRISRDAAFSLLSNRRRRQLLCLLVRSGEARSLRTTAREIVGRLTGCAPTDVADEAYRSVYVSLYQSHAPRLAAAGIVDYDETSRTVRLAHNRRTETLLRIVGIDPNGVRSADPRTVRLLTGAVAAAGLCGLLAVVDRVWLVPWTALVVGFLAFHARQYVRTYRLAPVRDCGDLATIHDSATDVVDDGAHPDQRQDHGRAE
jgi:hypothetical protein